MNSATGENKTCECGNVFFRTGNDKDALWKSRKLCAKCRQKNGRYDPVERLMGHYLVKSELIDKFLRGAL